MKTQTTTDRTARHHHSHFLSRRVFTNKRTREPRVVGWVSAEGIVLLSIKVLGSQRIPYYAKKTKLLYWPPSGDFVEGTCGGEFGYKAQLGLGVVAALRHGNGSYVCRIEAESTTKPQSGNG